MNGYVVSDLHLFARWSVAHVHMGRMRAAAARSDFFVFNGDVFDFRWTTLPTIEETVWAAVDWLLDFCSSHPECRVFYVMGNHDDFGLFADHLTELSAQTPNFFWHPSHVRIGNALFLHGDLVFDYRRPSNPFLRPLRQNVRKKSRPERHCHSVLHAFRFHRWHTPIFRRKRCARRILSSLEAAGLPAGVTDVFFGHTHLTFSNYPHGGVRFHNTGSAIGGLRCSMLPVRISAGLLDHSLVMGSGPLLPVALPPSD